MRVKEDLCGEHHVLIGALAHQTGVSPRLLRYYEDQGLLNPARRSGGYREYDEQHVRTVRSIRTLLAAGLGTRTIAELLPCVVDDGEDVVPGCAELLPELERERSRIDGAIADLEAARAGLARLMAATPPASSEDAEICSAPAEPAVRP